MVKQCMTALVFVTFLSSVATAQDARTVVSNASKAMGVENLNSVTMTGAGANFNLGQNTNANGPYPRANINQLVRTVDFTTPGLRASAETYGPGRGGGASAAGVFNQNITPMNTAWAQQLNIWTSPWGFLKGAAANTATTRVQTIGGKRYNVVTWSPAAPKSPSGQSYRVVGYINDQNLVEKVETWVENIMFGDMLVETTYSEYRDNNGLKYPTNIVQKSAGQPTFEAQIAFAAANPANLAQLMAPPAGRGGGPGGRGGPGAGGPPPAGGAAVGGQGGGAGGGRGAAPGGPGGRGGPGGPGGAPAVAAAEKMADGVWKITGGYTALVVEFSDHVVIVESGQSDARATAILTEAKKVVPNKPIRYVVNTHHHIDHSSGIPAMVAEGITVITHQNNKALWERALGAPRTLGDDLLAKKGGTVKAKIETVTGDKRVLQDATRTLELHVIKGLAHADGMLVAYLPKEKIVLQADLFNVPALPNPNAPPPAAPPAPAPVNVATVVFVANAERLGLDYQSVVSVHAPNPDRPMTRQDVLAAIGR
ncbi:MAG: hypothetical protein A3H95_03495 [Acidobacteria bacterium RIFCSPLOWO2_02_FULL_64_15]|nr:MAG: hypothetical protein A3H95_03495 [Acidobacteria bacterium RIFCSPLOWO2_02_FULL_64_15]